MSLIRSRIANSNRLRLLWAAALLVATAILVYFTHNTWLQALRGPRAISEDELLFLREPVAGNDYVTFTPKRPAVDTGLRYGKKNNEGTKYLVAAVENKLLLISARVASTDSTFTGRLELIKGTEQDVTTRLSGQDARFGTALMPCYLQTVRSIWFDSVLALCGIAVLGGIGSWLLVRGLMLSVSPTSHSLMKSLGRFGDANQTCDAIEEECASKDAIRIDRLIVTRNWLVSLGFASADVASVDEVVWIYKRVITGKGTVISAVVCLRDGKELGVSGPDETVNRMLTTMKEQMPWLPSGYDEKLAEIWKNQREAFLAVVDEARKEYTTGEKSQKPAVERDDY